MHRPPGVAHGQRWELERCALLGGQERQLALWTYSSRSAPFPLRQWGEQWPPAPPAPTPPGMRWVLMPALPIPQPRFPDSEA